MLYNEKYIDDAPLAAYTTSTSKQDGSRPMSIYTMERMDAVNQGWGDSQDIARIAENGGAPTTNEAYKGAHETNEEREPYEEPVAPHGLDEFFDQNPHLRDMGETYDSYAIGSIAAAEQAAMLERQVVADARQELLLAQEEIEKVRLEVKRHELREAAIQTVIAMMKEFAADEEDFQPSVNAELHQFIADTLEREHPELASDDLRAVMGVIEDFPPVTKDSAANEEA